MSINVPSRRLLTFGGQVPEPEIPDYDSVARWLLADDQGSEPNVQPDLRFFLHCLRAETSLEWNPWVAEELDVILSKQNAVATSPTNSSPTSTTRCSLSRSKNVRHGQRVKRVSFGPLPESSTRNPQADTPGACNLDSSAAERASSPSGLPSQGSQGVLRSSNPAPRVRNDKNRQATTRVPETEWPLQGPSAGLQPLPPLRATLRTSSPAASLASYSTALEGVIEPNSAAAAADNSDTLPGISWQATASPVQPQRAPKSDSDDFFRRFKAAIRAKARKKKRSKESWDYENPASLSSICRAQSTFLPATSLAGPSPPPDLQSWLSLDNNDGQRDDVVPTPTNKPPPQIPQVPQQRVSSHVDLTSKRDASTADSSVDALERRIATLQQQIETLERQQPQPLHTAAQPAAGGPIAAYAECNVCGDSLPETVFVGQITTQCAHRTHTCRECLAQWIATCLEARGWDQISCPECPQRLEAHDVKQSAEAAVFQRYDELATRAYLSTLPDFRWCRAAGCGSGQLHPESSGPLFKCAACGHKDCTKHDVWHGGEACREYEYRTGLDGGKRQQEEEASRKQISMMSKKCPGPGCGWRIEKNKGCDHMTCRKCRHEFCWQCMADYDKIRKKGNTAHKATCRYHTDNIS